MVKQTWMIWEWEIQIQKIIYSFKNHKIILWKLNTLFQFDQKTFPVDYYFLSHQT